MIMQGEVIFGPDSQQGDVVISTEGGDKRRAGIAEGVKHHDVQKGRIVEYTRLRSVYTVTKVLTPDEAVAYQTKQQELSEAKAKVAVQQQATQESQLDHRIAVAGLTMAKCARAVSDGLAQQFPDGHDFAPEDIRSMAISLYIGMSR